MSLTSCNVLNSLIGFGLAGRVGWVSQHIALGAILHIAKWSFKTALSLVRPPISLIKAYFSELTMPENLD